jgi:hypothetical protein
MTHPVAKRADQLVVGDRVPDEYLPHRFNKGPAEVVFVADDGEAHTFFAFRYPNGQHDSTTVLSESVLMVHPAVPVGHDYSRADDGEQPGPVAGRIPPHYGVVEVAGGLVEVDPPEGFVPASAARRSGLSPDGVPLCSHGDDADACQLFHPPVDQDAADAAAFDRGWIAEHRRAAKVDPPIAELDDVSCWVCGGSFPHSHAKAD